MSVMRRLEWLARRRMQGTLSGRHTSPDKGVSVEFAEHRSYAPGDDPRTLDWRIIARSDRNVVRQYIEETNLRTTLAVDVSGSMAYRGDKATSLNGKPLSSSTLRDGDRITFGVYVRALYQNRPATASVAAARYHRPAESASRIVAHRPTTSMAQTVSSTA